MSARESFKQHTGVQVPLICGAMYPCSNPELVAAVSKAGGIGIVQPISLTYVHGNDFRDGLRKIRSLTDKPVGLNAIVEKSSKVYLERMMKWVDIALEEGIRFFVTALGNPRQVVDKVHAAGGFVYHDVIDRSFALKARDEGVDGLICVNGRAGGHAGNQTPRALFESMHDLGLPLVCAGGIGDADDFVGALEVGYGAVQMGTRFIASAECTAHADYKAAIVDAKEEDIVLSEKISGVPVAVINTPYVESVGTKAGFVAKRMLRHPRLKHYIRTYYSLRSIWQLKKANNEGGGYKDYWQAGRSVAGVHAVEPAGDIVRRFEGALEASALAAQ